ncbi:MAG: hypothetical protein HY700_19405, partial [Gemmatimonadetes bacterium]|nr:hypothetical protein [Gemmatimonadota bacterium]
ITACTRPALDGKHGSGQRHQDAAGQVRVGGKGFCEHPAKLLRGERELVFGWPVILTPNEVRGKGPKDLRSVRPDGSARAGR